MNILCRRKIENRKKSVSAVLIVSLLRLLIVLFSKMCSGGVVTSFYKKMMIQKTLTACSLSRVGESSHSPWLRAW